MKSLLNRFEVSISEEKLILMSIEDFLISEETQGGHTCRNVFYVMNQVAKISNLDKASEWKLINTEMYLSKIFI